MIEAGRFRHRVRLEEEIELLNTSGDVEQDPVTGKISTGWVEVDEYWGEIAPISGREFISAQAEQQETTTKITIRVPPRIDSKMRFVHMVRGVPTTVYDIRGTLSDKESNLEYMTCPCASGVRYQP